MNVISLEYHETLMAGSGLQAQEALAEAVTKYSGKYVCVVEGSIPTRDKGVYMKLAGRPAMEVLADVGGKAAAIVAIGSCAAWGGIPSADPDPTGAVGVADLLPNQTIVNLPGCPPNPHTLLGVLLQFADSKTLPEMDAERRPKFAYDRDIHEHCPRRAHFDAGHFVTNYNLWGLEDKITCPYFNIGGQGEGQLAVDGQKFYDKLTCPKAQHIITTKEGGNAHCGVNNAGLEHQIIFDWLDDVFK